MLAMAHLVTTAIATAWHNVPIKLHTQPTTATHIRAYVARRSAHPTGTQSTTPEGGRFPSHPLVIPTQMGGPCTNSIWTSGTLEIPS